MDYFRFYLKAAVTPALNWFYSYIYTRMNFREYAKELRLYDGVEPSGSRAQWYVG